MEDHEETEEELERLEAEILKSELPTVPKTELPTVVAEVEQDEIAVEEEEEGIAGLFIIGHS